MKIVILTLFWLVLSPVQIGELTSVSGTIYDLNTKEPIPGLKLQLGDEHILMTDLNGSFSVDVAKGDHRIRFEINDLQSEIIFTASKEDQDLGWIGIDPAKSNEIRIKD